MNQEIQERRQCDRRLQQSEIQFSHIPPVVAELSRGFKNNQWTSHIDPISIPSRKEIVGLLQLTQQILFPGYFTNDSNEVLSPESLDYYLGQKIVALYESAAKQISSAIRHDCFRHNQSCVKCRENSYEKATAFINLLPRVRSLLESDIKAALEGDPAAGNADEVIFCYPGLYATMVYRLAHELVKLEVPIIPRIMSQYAYSHTAIDINPHARIGSSFFIDHGAGVVIGATSDIGNRVRIYQGVTLGALSLPRDAGERLRDTKRHPTIEDDVIIYANATILGGDTIIGARSIIGGNVWLTQSVGPDTKVILKRPELVYIGKKTEGDNP